MHVQQLLRQFGTDFETIARMFPTRTRAQIKAKYQKEDKIDTNRVGEALDDRKPIGEFSYRGVSAILNDQTKTQLIVNRSRRVRQNDWNRSEWSDSGRSLREDSKTEGESRTGSETRGTFDLW